MRIVGARERAVPISRYASGERSGLTTSIVALETDALQDGKRVTGYGFSSVGRYAQSGLIRERFLPRLLAAEEEELLGEAGELDPFRAWNVMMRGEKPGGHGERCVAVGTLDMALWDAAAKIAGLPLYELLARRTGRPLTAANSVAVYAGGGYYYERDDLAQLRSEVQSFIESGYAQVKMKIAGAPIARDCERIEAVLALLPSGGALAVDAMNAYDREGALVAAKALQRYNLWWFEDVCDPLDFETQAAVAREYGAPIAAGEALFSQQEAELLHRHGGLRPQRDVLLFDPVHCYGIPGYLRIVDSLERAGWPRSAFWPHGGHLFTLHVARALGLGGAEVNPLAFAPFGGLAGGASVENGRTAPPDVPGIGLEAKRDLGELLRTL